MGEDVDAGGGQYHLDPGTYLAVVETEVPASPSGVCPG